MLTELLIFPCCAILWLLICERLGLVIDEPLIYDASLPPYRKDRGIAFRT